MDIELIALNRLAFGPRPGEADRIRKMGFAAWVDEQLAPNDAADPVCAEYLRDAKIHIEYDAGEENDKAFPAVKEDRPLKTLGAPLPELWSMVNGKRSVPGPERERPFLEVKTATWLRAIYSKFQLREVLVDFWHNHFNVNAMIDNERVLIVWPVYDRDVIRKHSLGNFRAFLEAVATSVPMLLYLNNASSKASPANENYARELFELHTLGAQHYFNHLYNRWRDVPGATDGKPVGYIDQDVYEAARAFTGWTIADGSENDHGAFPNTGEFHYCAAWHDPYQKRVLGTELDANQPPLADGRKVLDLVANHPATATFVCTKLCRRLIADEPPAALIEKAAAVFKANAAAPDQIAKVVRVIALSPEFAATWGQKVKRPFDSVVAFLRATEADVRPDNDLFYLAERMGQRMFNWPTPDGHPDRATHWTGTNTMLGRWNAPAVLLDDNCNCANFRLIASTPATAKTTRQITAYWANRMLSRDVDKTTIDTIASAIAPDGKVDAPLHLKEKEQIDIIRRIVALIAMTPDFQEC